MTAATAQNDNATPFVRHPSRAREWEGVPRNAGGSPVEFAATPDRPLTKKQAAILRFIVTYVATNGRCPCWDDIGDAFGIASPNGVSAHINALMRKGYVRMKMGMSRSIEVVGLRLQIDYSVDEAGVRLREVMMGEKREA